MNELKVSRFDGNDILFYSGLLMLFIGLAFGISWPVACMAIGGILVAVGLINSFAIVWLNNR